MKRKLGPDGPEEVEVGSGRPRVSEAYSDSSCDSGAMEVQRIHSGLPVLPETWNWKAEGAAPPCPRSLTDDSDGRVVERDHVVERVAEVDRGHASTEALQKECTPQTFAAPSHTYLRQIIEQPLLNCCASSAAGSVAVRLGWTQRAGAFTVALSTAALQQQLSMLEGDEQALLAELRSMRREYDARVDVLRQNVPMAAGVALSLGQNTIPMSHHHNGMHKQQRSQSVQGANGWLLSLDTQSGVPLAVGQAVNGAPCLTDTDAAAARGRHAGAAASGMMPPPPPPPATQRWAAQGARQERAPKKPPMAVRPIAGALTTIPHGSQTVASGASSARNTEPGLLARPRFAPTDPRGPDAALSLPPTFAEAGRAGPGAPTALVAAAAAAHLQLQPRLPPDVDVLEALLRSGSGGEAPVGNLLTPLMQRGRQQQQQQ